MRSTSPPPAAVLTATVPSPASGAVMKRDTKAVAPSPLIDTWRGLPPTPALPVCAIGLVLNLSTWPVASSATSAKPPLADITMPNGCEARGSAKVRLNASVVGLITLIVALCLFATHSMPSGATATVRGALPTVISACLTRVTASNTDTVSLSWFTTHRRAFAPLRGSRARLLDAVGLCALSGR